MGLSVLRSSQELWLEEISRLIMSWKITVCVLLLCLCVCEFGRATIFSHFQLMPRLRMGLCCSLMMPPYNVWQCQSHLSVLAPLMNHVSLSLSLLLPLSLVSHSAPLSPTYVLFLLKVGFSSSSHVYSQ